MNGWESWSTASLVLMALELIPYKVVEQTLGSPDSILKLSEGAQLELFRWIFNFKTHSTQGLFRDWTKSWTTMQHDAHWLRVGDTSGSLSVDLWRKPITSCEHVKLDVFSHLLHLDVFYIWYFIRNDFNFVCIPFVSLCLPSPEGTQEVFSLPLQVCTKVQEPMKIFAVEMMYRCTFGFF